MQNFLEIAKNRFYGYLQRRMDLSYVTGWNSMDSLAGERLDAEASVGNSAAGIFIFLLVSVDWIVFHEGFGRKCVLENPVAFTSGGDHSLCGMSAAETVFRALATGGISGITGSHWTGREMCAFLRVV